MTAVAHTLGRCTGWRTAPSRRTSPPTAPPACPPAGAGAIGARGAPAPAAPPGRAGLRQLATTPHSPLQLIDEPATGWGIAATQIRRVTMHVRLTAGTADVHRDSPDQAL